MPNLTSKIVIASNLVHSAQLHNIIDFYIDHQTHASVNLIEDSVCGSKAALQFVFAVGTTRAQVTAFTKAANEMFGLASETEL